MLLPLRWSLKPLVLGPRYRDSVEELRTLFVAVPVGAWVKPRQTVVRSAVVPELAGEVAEGARAKVVFEEQVATPETSPLVARTSEVRIPAVEQAAESVGVWVLPAPQVLFVLQV